MAAGLETAAELSVRANPSSPRSTNQHPCPDAERTHPMVPVAGVSGCREEFALFSQSLICVHRTLKADTHYPRTSGERECPRSKSVRTARPYGYSAYISLDG